MELRFSCPYLDAEVVFTEERQEHVTRGHAELFPARVDQIALTLRDPDVILRSTYRDDTRRFWRWIEAEGKGRYVVVVVVSDQLFRPRHWIVTAHLSRRMGQGEVEWARS